MEPIYATSLDDLGPVTLEVPVPRPDGQTVVVRVKGLTEGEAWEIRKTIEWPEVPIVDFAAGGKPVKDPNDKKYRTALTEANRLFARKCLIRGLQLDVPGDDETAKLATLESKLGNYAFLLLVDAAEKVNQIGAAEVAQVAASFRPIRDGVVPGDAPLGADAAAVAAS